MSSQNLSIYVEKNELPTDPEVLEQLMNSWGKEDVEQVETAVAENAATGVTESVSDNAEIEPDGILSKDGKHVIPYDALKSERQARQEYQNRAAKLEAQLAARESVTSIGDITSEFEGFTAEELDELREYLPDQYEKVVRQHEALINTSKKAAQLEQQETERQKNEEAAAAQNVQELIDNNPTLSHWQRNNPEAFDHCIALDNIARANPINSKLTMEQRFEKVVKQALIDYENPFPETVKKDLVPAVKTQAKPPISSLSTFKGGEAAENTLAERTSDLSTAEISEQLMKMTPQEQDLFLTKIALGQ